MPWKIDNMQSSIEYVFRGLYVVSINRCKNFQLQHITRIILSKLDTELGHVSCNYDDQEDFYWHVMPYMLYYRRYNPIYWYTSFLNLHIKEKGKNLSALTFPWDSYKTLTAAKSSDSYQITPCVKIHISACKRKMMLPWNSWAPESA